MKRSRGLNLSAVWIIIGINLLLFLATLVDSELQFTLGLKPADFTKEPWTIVTSMFVHAGFLHILFNMFSLYFFGTYVSMLIGEKKFLMIYFLGGLLGNVFYIILGNPDYTVIGASGAIFAVGGALTVLRPKLKVVIIPIPVPLPLWVAVIGMFLIISIFPNVAWQAHLGGLLFGAATGYLFKKRQRYFF